MQDDVGGLRDLVNYRLEKAEKVLAEAKTLSDFKMYTGANNRIYYAIFNAINAVHAINGFSSKSHKRIIGEFVKEYIKTNVFDREYGRIINKIQSARNTSDYDDFIFLNEKETVTNYEFAVKFIDEIKNYCKEAQNEL